MANCGRCNHREVCRCFPNPEEYCSYFEPERQHGEWIVIAPNVSSKCPFCSTLVGGTPNYCPKCGASMISSNSEIEKSKSEIVPDYRDGWRVKEGDEE